MNDMSRKKRNLASNGAKSMNSEYRIIIVRNPDLTEKVKKRQLEMPGNDFNILIKQDSHEDIEMKLHNPQDAYAIEANFRSRFEDWKEDGSFFEFGNSLLLMNINQRKRNMITLSEYVQKRDEIERYVMKLYEYKGESEWHD